MGSANVVSLRRCATIALLFLGGAVTGLTAIGAQTVNRVAYYRDPAVHGDTVVFTAEGDLWTVPTAGGVARRLTSAPGMERGAKISPDGKTIAFYADYEGPTEVYTMPLAGGLPERRTWDGRVQPVGWAPDGKLVISTIRYSGLRDPSLVLLGSHGERERIPLATGSEAAYSADGKSLFFTRLEDQGSKTKRYKGGFTQNIWRWDGSGEAIPLTADYLGTSRDPMVMDGRLLFVSDRDGVMNVFSGDLDGKGVKQESHQEIFDVESASASDGHVVYASAGELWSLDCATGQESRIPVTLQSDFDQMREHWVSKPMEYISDVHLSPDGEMAVMTARGEVFTVPARPGRIAKVASDSAIRFRSARFLPDGKNLLMLSTETGETEFWKYPANGEGPHEQWTHGAKVLQWDGVASPDGNWLAHTNKDQELLVYDVEKKTDKRIAQSMVGNIDDLSWSPDSRWLAFSEGAANMYVQVKVLEVSTGKLNELTSDRYDSMNPVWSSDGKWMYFLSDRSLRTTVRSPWGPRRPQPHFDRSVKIFEVALMPDQRSPFLAADELHPDEKEKPEEKKEDSKQSTVEDKSLKLADEKKGKPKTAGSLEKEKGKDVKGVPEVKIDFTNILERVSETPAPAGNYDGLASTEKRLCWLSRTDEVEPKTSVQCLDVANKGEGPDTLMSDVKSMEVSQDRKKILLSKDDDFFIVDSDAKGAGLDPKTLGKAKLDLSHWQMSTTPRDEYRGIFFDAWRLERDYFYDRHMQGVDWVAMRERYLPLVDRVSDRDELNDVIAQMVSELSALHTFVGGGDERKPADNVDLAALGADLRRDEKAGGFVVLHVYAHDPDMPWTAPPFARQESMVKEGEVLTAIDGTETLGVTDERALLRGKVGTQVLLRVKGKDGAMRDVLVKPVSAADDSQLRYSEWELQRRQRVESASANQIGYVHLRAMGPDDIERWTREYYPVFDRQGLIIDVRHNNGGNIDSWLLGDLLRKPWFYWQPRVGQPTWNMQYAFRGHIVVLCDQETASDGEAFAEGFKRFKMGTVIGMRTWGGEIWLSGRNTQADGGVATAAETGVYGPEGKWLIEGHGVDPDTVVDNLPHATFTGEDAQLDAAVTLLKQQIAAEPRPVPPPPAYPDKSFHYQ
jgi:tricorn protease